ncbi:sporulation protein YabP [Desulfosporosinus hippei]|uniref:Sporulation protein YabP n=1 Tax=Desulfosporosinus hippei DSM 8344 TaxID=1121419 RepID=A0A1G7WVN0_9FIRM|nr:sporulation protein YabP [Desulfosporosinus hippei]SDG75983.1 sporulation protein YabP [Desulfosporosinus hippei DSM 8344]
MVEKAAKGHRLVMENRELLELSGIRKVQSFDPKEIILETELGILSVKGDQLSIKLLNLEEGLVDLQGSVGALIYHRSSGNASRRGFLNRVFR